EGEIEVLDYDVPALRVREVAELRRSIGVVSQAANLLPGRTVYENVAFVLRVLGTPRREITPRVFDALRAVGLSSRAQAYPAQLSQGEAQRAALARAIARNPLLLLADEPTGSLDDTMAAEVVDIVKDIWTGGTTVLFATHQARLAAALRQRTLTLVGGRLGKDASVAEQLPANPLPASLEVTLTAEGTTPEGARGLIARLSGLSEADEVGGGIDWIERLARGQRLLEVIGLGVGAVLAMAAI